MAPTLRLAALAAAALGALALAHGAHPARAAEPAGQACLRVSHIQSTKFADPHTLYLRTDDERYYRLDFSASCWDAANETLIIHPVANDDEVCGAVGLDIAVRATGERCIAAKLTRLTPAEAAAIPPHDRP